MNDFGEVLFFGNYFCCYRSWCGSCPLMGLLFICCLLELLFLLPRFTLALVVWAFCFSAVFGF